MTLCKQNFYVALQKKRDEQDIFNCICADVFCERFCMGAQGPHDGLPGGLQLPGRDYQEKCARLSGRDVAGGGRQLDGRHQGRPQQGFHEAIPLCEFPERREACRQGGKQYRTHPEQYHFRTWGKGQAGPRRNKNETALPVPPGWRPAPAASCRL